MAEECQLTSASRSGFVNEKEESGRLFFLIGLPHSGKSTFANRWCREADIDCPRVVLAGDDFRRALTGMEYLPNAEATVFANIDVAARALLMRGFDVLIDETSTTEWTIARYLKLDVDARPIWIETPVLTCVERALAADRNYLIEPIYRMHRQLAALKENWAKVWTRLRNQAIFRQTMDTPK